MGTLLKIGFMSVALVLPLFGVTSARAGLLTIGPDYKRPTNAIPPTYKAAELGACKKGRPLDNLLKGIWW